MEIGKLLMAIGLVAFFFGLLHYFNILGKLPGDFVYKGEHTTIYFPLASSIIFSVILSIVLYLLNK